ncbi:MAG: hypothetical protein EOP33_04780 [Rickettsiaceae bacterium]|nr:MAG: hypothetical protein EOP33_04780 [Rickettsiaceae bacterium]
MSKEPFNPNQIDNQVDIALEKSIQKAEIFNIVDAQNQQIKYLTFGGGGAKGIAYSGVYSALYDLKIMDNVLAVAGSSAGAITAAMIATGISPQNFDQLLKQTDLSLLPGKGILINKDGNPLYKLIADNVAKNILQYFNNKNFNQLLEKRSAQIIGDLQVVQQTVVEKKREIALLNQDLPKFDVLNSELDKLEGLQNLLIEHQSILEKKGYVLVDLIDKVSQNGKITFTDLKFLNALDPCTFKNLVITAVKREDGALKIFDAENTPEVEIALACRASGSLPLFFKPAIIDGIEYVDGGFRDNNPTKYFEPSIALEEHDKTKSESITSKKKESRILIFAFGTHQQNDLVHTAIYSAIDKIYNPSKLYELLVNVIYKSLAKIGGNFKYTDTVENTAQELRLKSHDTILIDTPGVGTISFKQANEKSKYLHIKSYIQTMEHVDNHHFDSKYEIDPNIAYKKTILEIYERSIADSSWVSKLSSKNNEEQANLILSILEPNKWQKQPSSSSQGGPIDNKEREVLIKQMIANVASKGNSSPCDAKNISKIITTLNSNSIPIEAKKEFARILSDGRSEENIYTKKFQEKDFKNLLSQFNKNNSNLQQRPSRL